MKVVALAVCVAAAVAVSFFMHENVPPWTGLVCIVLFAVSFLLGRRTASAWPALLFVFGAVGLTALGVVGSRSRCRGSSDGSRTSRPRWPRLRLRPLTCGNAPASRTRCTTRSGTS